MARWPAAALAAAAVLAACSGGSKGAAPAPSTAPVSSTTVVATTAVAPSATATVATTATPVAGACASSMLALTSREGLGALGHALYILELRNSSPQACRLMGYPAVSLLGGDGRVLAEAQPGAGYILPDRPPTAVSVAGGGSAFFGVESFNVCTGGGPPAIAPTVRVTPPGASAPLVLSAEINVCAGQPVRVSPVRPTERDVAS